MKKLPVLTLIAVLAFCACNTLNVPEGEPFEVDIKSPSAKIGEIEFQINKMFPLPGIRKIAGIVSYFPGEDAVCVQFRYDFMSYYLFWSIDGRENFVKALDAYKADFDARNFGKSSRQTKRAYGAVNGYLSWQGMEFTKRARTGTILDFGYFFQDKRPYFTINQRETTYTDPQSPQDPIIKSETSYYFTRAQADELAALFDPEFLAGISRTSIRTRDMEVDFEEY